MCSTLSHRKASRPVRSQSSGTADAGRVPADGSGHAALLPLLRFLARQAALEATRAEPFPASNFKDLSS
jgi:hypothetical protein